MTRPAQFLFDAPGDLARAAELRRVKTVATAVLAATLALFVAAKLLLPIHPAFGFVAAFAEAATIVDTRTRRGVSSCPVSAARRRDAAPLRATAMAEAVGQPDPERAGRRQR